MSPRTFRSPRELRDWLETNGRTATELLVRCYKTHATEKGLTYPQAVDEALCFGWIDGVRRAVDGDSFSVRFTPRKPKSYWSAVNIRRAKELERKGRMRPAGRAAFEARETKSARRYSFENKPRRLEPHLEKRFRADRKAWGFFLAQAPWYQRICIFWVMEAKREETRVRRVEELIQRSARSQPIKLLAGKKLRTPS